ncbi:C40 family peptidase [Leptolyngbya sp. AN03gr2]|uniref:C40 family peptidase n=1 Tax=unclassified Leptolyngbya TaxID=2650499 RepID=UPI003D30F5D1
MQYRTIANLNLYDSPDLNRLATQAAAGRYLKILSDEPLQVMTCEDDYPGYLDPQDLKSLEKAEESYQAAVWTAEEIRDRISEVIEFTQTAMSVPNEYLWGGTVAPDYDCSGLMQAAFASVGIRLPRDAYQQEAFLQPVEVLIPGDLVFFGTPEKATHVGLYLGNQQYIHSSGKDRGRNGIHIDRLSVEGDAIEQYYYSIYRGAGRVSSSYIPQQ